MNFNSEPCRSCQHPPHLGDCTKRDGGTAYACGCSAQTPLTNKTCAHEPCCLEPGHPPPHIGPDGHGGSCWWLDDDTRTTLVHRVKNCARCGQEHTEIPGVKRLTLPVLGKDGDVIGTHWAPCPTNGEPILIRIIETIEITDAKLD